MTDRRRIGLWLCSLGLLASCTASTSVTPGPGETAARGSAVVGSASSSDIAASGLRTFREEGLTFSYPAAWREFHHPMVSSFSNSIADLATVDVPEPCATSQVSGGTQIECGDRFSLTPDTLVVRVTGNGMPGFYILNRPPGTTSLMIDGLPAYFASETPPDPAIHADVEMTWTIARPDSVDNYYMISALIKGPHMAPMEVQLKAMIASLRYDPPVVPLPSASGAADVALAKAIDVMAPQSATWRCLPTHTGAARAQITEFPNGPSFSKPREAICTTKVEPTALQLWLSTFTIKLAEPDPAGSGWTVRMWISPDGSPGEMSGGDPSP